MCIFCACWCLSSSRSSRRFPTWSARTEIITNRGRGAIVIARCQTCANTMTDDEVGDYGDCCTACMREVIQRIYEKIGFSASYARLAAAHDLNDGGRVDRGEEKI